VKNQASPIFIASKPPDLLPIIKESYKKKEKSEKLAL
jgi:hypothetical protein